MLLLQRDGLILIAFVVCELSQPLDQAAQGQARAASRGFLPGALRSFPRGSHRRVFSDFEKDAEFCRPAVWIELCCAS
jgi:hypothetical protein